ncbi:MAG: tyrosine--tRNA ligase [Patescibacteria group bacterium]
MKTLDEKIKLIKSVANGGEIIGEDELPKILEKEKPICYDGFEPSGKIHIAQGLVRAINVNKMTNAGFKFKILIADWHAACNHKFGGDLEKIKIGGRYFIEVWKSCGMNLENVEFIWVSDYVKDPNYWELVLKISQTTNLPRIMRTIDIMGRTEKDVLTASQILYPCMQCADIFYLNADVCQLGLDQRKVNMLAREIGPELGFWKPTVVSHRMMSGLLAPEKSSEEMSPIEKSIAKKMSKSKPETAIFMTDSVSEVERKIMQAFCPMRIVEENPVLEYYKFIVFEKFESVKIENRITKSLQEFFSYEELEKEFVEDNLSLKSLKQVLAEKINLLLDSTRKHFVENEEAKKFLEQIESFQITR